MEELYIEYDLYLDYSFKKRFSQQGLTRPCISELLAFHILSQNNFFFKSRVKKDQFPDIITTANQKFEVATSLQEIDTLYDTTNLVESDNKKLIRITSVIRDKNKSFISHWCSSHLIIFIWIENTIVDDRVFMKLEHGNSELIYNITEKAFYHVNPQDFTKSNNIKIPPLKDNIDITSNIESILFIWIGPLEFIWEIMWLDINKISSYHWKNPKYKVDFDLKI